jgi:hypothetical protein
LALFDANQSKLLLEVMFPFAEVAAFTIRVVSFLVFHKNQHAVITNSLKIRLPKVFLAVIVS